MVFNISLTILYAVRADDLVTKHNKENDICPTLYPSSFELVVPKGVLKALRYSG